MHHVGHQAVGVQLVGHVGHSQFLGLLEKRQPLGAVGQHGQLVVDGVHGRQLEARDVLVATLRAEVARDHALPVTA